MSMGGSSAIHSAFHTSDNDEEDEEMRPMGEID